MGTTWMRVIVDEDMTDRRSLRAGYLIGGLTALLMLLLLLFIGVLVTLTVSQDRTAARYPGSTEITSHSNYGGLPRQIRWDNSYYTADSFTDVYNWYSTEFNLGAESRAIGRCILLDGPVDSLIWQRYYSVLICNTDGGQMVYVTRSTIFRSPL